MSSNGLVILGGCFLTCWAVELIYCVRHPFDVLTSTHPATKHIRKYHITYERWESEYNAFLALRKNQIQREIFILKYEDCKLENTKFL